MKLGQLCLDEPILWLEILILTGLASMWGLSRLNDARHRKEEDIEQKYTHF